MKNYLHNLKNSNTARATLVVIILRIISIIVAFALSVFLTRVLGLSDFGVYAVYMATTTLVVLPITSGIPNLIVRESASAFADGNLAKIRGLISFILFIILAYLVGLALLLLAAYVFIGDWVIKDFIILLWLHVLLQGLAAMRSSLLRASGFIVKGQLLERSIQPVLTLVFSVALAFTLGDQFDVFYAICSFLAAHLIALLWGGIWIKKYVISAGESESVDKSRVIREGLHFSGTGLVSSVMINGIVLIVGNIGSYEAAGQYRIATSLAQPLIFAHEVLGQVFAPKLAQYYQKSNQLAIEHLLRIAVMASFLSVSIGTILLFFIGEKILIMAFGPESKSAYTITMILALAHCANAAGGLRDMLLNMAGKAKPVFHITLALTVITVAISYFTITHFGAYGAALALLGYQLSATIWLSLKTFVLTGHNPSVLYLSGKRV